MRTTVKNIIEKYNNDKTRLMDILIDTQNKIGFIPNEAVEVIAEGCGLSKVDVEQTLSFYHFFSTKPVGEYAVYLNNSVVAEMKGRADVAKAFEEEVGCAFGSVTEDGKIGLHDTACIGMSDQEPAAIINNVVFTKLTPERAKDIVSQMKAGKTASEIVVEKGDGKNATELINSMVFNNIRKSGEVIFSDYEIGAALKKVGNMKPEEVIDEVK
jgi:[NiFe] hydrogenase diaphorase moiety large subunit